MFCLTVHMCVCYEGTVGPFILFMKGIAIYHLWGACIISHSDLNLYLFHYVTGKCANLLATIQVLPTMEATLANPQLTSSYWRMCTVTPRIQRLKNSTYGSVVTTTSVKAYLNVIHPRLLGSIVFLFTSILALYMDITMHGYLRHQVRIREQKIA